MKFSAFLFIEKIVIDKLSIYYLSRNVKLKNAQIKCVIKWKQKN